MSKHVERGYAEKLPLLSRLKRNLEDAIRLFLSEAEIPFLAVYGRVKTLTSFQEKIARKSYTDPFGQTFDLVGIRIIVYFPKDIDRVLNLIEKEFTVLEKEDKSAALNINEFGYRSIHNTIEIKKEWCSPRRPWTGISKS